jgi:fibro-slime domain-containing protein
MKLTPVARGCSAPEARSVVARGAFGIGVVAFALLAGCGAGGDGDKIVTTGDDNGGSSATGGGGPRGSGGAPSLTPNNCSGPSCELATDEPLPTPANCGDGVLTDDEACDDGNRVSGDGCNEQCLVAEPGFSCASPGKPCQRIARCGDGVVAPTEQCDDANVTSGDGCSSRCRVELGKKCEGAPSVCTDAVCGNGIIEGAEACDDGNTVPFDGCSPICLKEPNCEGLSCVSECGDGLVINEQCDDGNRVDGDGCSSTCTIETGFTCDDEAACELIGGQCALRVPAIFRDFAESRSDFGDLTCTALALGGVGEDLDAEGRPVAGPNAAAACMDPAQFGDWYRSGQGNVPLIGEITLFDNGAGGYVNRFGAQGEPFTAVDPTTERGGENSLAACEQACVNEATNGNAPFVGGALRCNDLCRPFNDDIQQQTTQRNQLVNQLTQAQNAATPDDVAIADLTAQIAAIDATIAQAQLDGDACLTDCQAQLDARVATCTPTCKPCNRNPALFCRGGEEITFDGNPLFFPVDGMTGATAEPRFAAKIPEQYGYDGFPNESFIFPGAPNHNFYFTSEVQYWFKYDANTQATLKFLGDDDVWVFLNGHLAVDLGGIHVPSNGAVTIDAPAGTVNAFSQDGREGTTAGVPAAPPVNRNGTPDDYGLVPGNVYKITVFQAERQRDGSSFQLTLAGFEATPSNCTAVCGDGILSFGEECDDGVNNGGYGECGADCVLGPFCGDSIVQPEFGETCDVGPGGDGACRGCRLITIQ